MQLLLNNYDAHLQIFVKNLMRYVNMPSTIVLRVDYSEPVS